MPVGIVPESFLSLSGELRSGGFAVDLPADTNLMAFLARRTTPDVATTVVDRRSGGHTFVASVASS